MRYIILLTLTLVACTPAQRQKAASWLDLAGQGAQTLLPLLDFCEDSGAAQEDVETARRLTMEALELAGQNDPAVEEKLRLAVSAVGSIIQRLEARGVDIPPAVDKAQRMLVGLVVVPRAEEGLKALHERPAVPD